MSVPPTTSQINCQARESGVPFQESTRYSIISQSDVYRLQNVGYIRAQTCITQTDLEICISGSSTLIQFIRRCLFHPVDLQNLRIGLDARSSEVMNMLKLKAISVACLLISL